MPDQTVCASFWTQRGCLHTDKPKMAVYVLMYTLLSLPCSWWMFFLEFEHETSWTVSSSLLCSSLCPSSPLIHSAQLTQWALKMQIESFLCFSQPTAAFGMKFNFPIMAYKIPKPLAPDHILDFALCHFPCPSFPSIQISSCSSCYSFKVMSWLLYWGLCTCCSHTWNAPFISSLHA